MDSPYRQELLVAIGAVQRAAAISRVVISAQDKGVIEKEDLSPVTVGDFAIQALLTATMHRAFPDDRFVGEESAAQLRDNLVLLDRVWDVLQQIPEEGDSLPSCCVPESKGQMCDMIDWCGSGEPGGPGKGRVWVFDPIDGTKTFVRGEMYAINVALLKEGKQVLGVVACPLLSATAQFPVMNDTADPTGDGCLVFAVKGHGAYVRPLREPRAGVEARKIEPHPTTSSLGSLRSVSAVSMIDSGIDDAHKIIAEKLGIAFPGCDLLGWVVRWVAMALGLANMTVWVYKKRDRRAKLWDHAGAILAYEEAGGKVTDVLGRGIDFGAGRKLTANFGFVAAPRDVHHRVLRLVHETLREQGKAHLLDA